MIGITLNELPYLLFLLFYSFVSSLITLTTPHHSLTHSLTSQHHNKCQFKPTPSIHSLTHSMGCSSSSLPDLERDQELLLQKHFHYSDDDLAQLYKAFRKIDVTKSRRVEFDEFCMRWGCEGVGECVWVAVWCVSTFVYECVSVWERVYVCECV